MKAEGNRSAGFKGALTFILVAAFSFGSNFASAEEIASWTDAQGVTHFGNTQFAPASARTLNVKSANRMDVPASVPSSSGSGQTNWVVIDQAPKQNKKGWRAKGDGPRNGPIGRSSTR